MKVVVPEVYGFCNGVRSALMKADNAVSEASRCSMPCYLYGSIVHNRVVSASFEERGVRTLLSPEDAEPGIVIIRTHGIADEKLRAFRERGFRIVDATCPVVLMNMAKARSAEGPVVIIGKKGHSEIEALQGARPDALVIEKAEDLGLLSGTQCSAVIQTTLSVSLLEDVRKEARRLGIDMRELNSICGASEARRRSLISILGSVDCVIVVGDSESANSRELRDLAASYGKPSFLALYPEELPDAVFSYRCAGLTAGASAPDELFQRMKSALEEHIPHPLPSKHI